MIALSATNGWTGGKAGMNNGEPLGGNMKFIVDKMPEYRDKCIFAEWKPYPPIIEKAGDYKCKNDGKICDLDKTGCRWLKVNNKRGNA